MMWPSSAAISSGRNVRTPRYTPPQQTAKVRSHTRRSSVTIDPPPPMPALLNSRLMWSVECSASTASRNASNESSSDTSHTWVVTTTPSGAASRARRRVSAISSTDMSHMATWHPSAASCTTSSRPIPLAPPVTTAIFPSKLCIGACWHSDLVDCFTGTVAYTGDILDDFAASKRGPTYPDVVVETNLLVADRASGFDGAVVRWSAEGVTIQNRNDYVRHFSWKPGGFLIEGKPVTLVRPATAKAATQRITASGSVAGDGRARVAAASRIWVEGKHDAELLEHVWGDDLRELGIVVEPLHGADDLAAAVAEFGPSVDRRLGVLLDHLVPGSKETRIAETVRDPNVLITGHPFVDVWAGIRPKVLGLDEWPDIPKGDVPWKEGLCAALGVPFEGFWPRCATR